MLYSSNNRLYLSTWIVSRHSPGTKQVYIRSTAWILNISPQQSLKYHENKSRSFFSVIVMGVLLTLAAVLVMLIILLRVVGIPLSRRCLYRFALHRTSAKWVWVTLGALTGCINSNNCLTHWSIPIQFLYYRIHQLQPYLWVNGQRGHFFNVVLLDRLDYFNWR